MKPGNATTWLPHALELLLQRLVMQDPGLVDAQNDTFYAPYATPVGRLLFKVAMALW